jgi:chemotaxis protein MotB
VKALARKKREQPSGGGAGWLATFADLMNLLLCFFVLLFSMSSVDAEKFEQIAVSMANNFGVFDAGSSSIGEGQLISSGMTQLNDLSEMFNTMGQTSQQTGQEIEKDNEDPNKEDGENGLETSEDEEIKEAMEKIAVQRQEVTKGMYDEVSDLTDKFRLNDYVELSLDSDYQFVQLTLKGSILYDSGRAEIKEDAKPILSKVGDVLGNFEGYTLEILGHTDNVPMSSSNYKDNNWLSSARALNAAEYLIKYCGINPSNLKYSGRGEYDPISSNSTPEGRAKNRRIEIKIYNEYSGN